jgi:hypothetical protein
LEIEQIFFVFVSFGGAGFVVMPKVVLGSGWLTSESLLDVYVMEQLAG